MSSFGRGAKLSLYQAGTHADRTPWQHGMEDALVYWLIVYNIYVRVCVYVRVCNVDFQLFMGYHHIPLRLTDRRGDCFIIRDILGW